MASPARFERATPALGGRCSIQLSYGDVGASRGEYGGAEGDRTLDLRIANATLSQLSYRPTTRAAILAIAIRDVQWSFEACDSVRVLRD
jgi:hypothetical protein